MHISIEEFRVRIEKACSPLPGSIPYTNYRPMSVPGRFDNRHLLEFLTEYHPHVGLEEWTRRIESGRIKVEGTTGSRDTIVRGGMRLIHEIRDVVEPEVSSDIRLVYGDEEMLALRKPSPLPVHPCGRYNKNTLACIVGAAFPEFEPRLVHRLDADTTGLQVLALSKESARCLQQQFENRETTKVYLCLVDGMPEEKHFILESDIARAPTVQGKRDITEEGQGARTECFVVSETTQKKQALLVVIPHTGRTNQIRLHLASHGLPIVGDAGYSGESEDDAPFTMEQHRLMLHAWKLRIAHPVTKEKMSLTAAPPSAIADCITEESRIRLSEILPVCS